MTIQKYAKKTFYGWMSEDDYLGWRDRFLYSEGIEVLENPRVIQLWKKTIKSCYTDEAPKNFLEIVDRTTNSVKVLAFCDDWQVYHHDNDTAVYDNSSLRDLEYPVFVADDYVYFVNSTGSTSAMSLNRITVSNAASSTWSGVTTGYKTLSNNNYYEYFSSCVVGNFIYIGIGSKIDKIDGAWVLTTFDFTGGEEIVKMLYWGGQIKIITETGKLHLWDGTSDNPIETIDLGTRIQDAFQVANVIYVQTGFLWINEGLYYLNGFTLVPVFRETESDLLGIPKMNFKKRFNSSMTNDADNLYVLDYNSGDAIPHYRVGLFWRKKRGLPASYVYEANLNSRWNKMQIINCILHSQGNLYIGYSENGNYWVDRISTSTPVSTGYIVTNVEDFDVWVYRKGQKHIKFKVENIDSDHTIEVQQSIDGGAFTSIKTITEQPEDNVAKITTGFANRDFREMSLKFILTTNNSISPKIYHWYEFAYEIKDI